MYGEKIIELFANIIQSLKSYQFLSNTLYDYIFAFILFIILYIILFLFRKILINKISKLAESTSTNFDETVVEIIKSLPKYFYLVIGLYFPLKTLILNNRVGFFIDAVFWIVILIEFIKAGVQLCGYFLRRVIIKSEEDESDITNFNLIMLLIKIGFWSIGILLFLANLGFEITPLLASLGVGGVAVGFALQNILQDIFSSFSIYLDKPFKIGDFIETGGDYGTIEKVGIKTTRITTLQGQQLIVANKELTNARVNNFGVMDTRRIVFDIKVVYDTSLENLKKIPDIVKNIFEEDKLIKDNTELQRVHFKEFGEYSLNYEVVYNVNISDYDTYMDVQQNINFNILEKFQENEIKLAYKNYLLN